MESVWSDSCKFDKRDTLLRDIECDVLIIGAGIAGILTGYFLRESGKNVIIIERNRIASGNTKKTTAKITSQHDLIYEDTKRKDKEKVSILDDIDFSIELMESDKINVAYIEYRY